LKRAKTKTEEELFKEQEAIEDPSKYPKCKNFDELLKTCDTKPHRRSAQQVKLLKSVLYQYPIFQEILEHSDEKVLIDISKSMQIVKVRKGKSLYSYNDKYARKFFYYIILKGEVQQTLYKTKPDLRQHLSIFAVVKAKQAFGKPKKSTVSFGSFGTSSALLK